MVYNPNIHHRRSIRLKGYDYSRAGLYFVTICVRNRKHLFGEIRNGEMCLNAFGKIVHDEWLKTSIVRSNVQLGEFVVMPNHFHGIVEITKNDFMPVGALRATPKNEYMSSISPKSNELATIIRAFKSATTKRINESYRSFGEKLWQPNYYEHIIRNNHSHQHIANYITCNPATWENDRFFK